MQFCKLASSASQISHHRILPSSGDVVAHSSSRRQTRRRPPPPLSRRSDSSPSSATAPELPPPPRTRWMASSAPSAAAGATPPDPLRRDRILSSKLYLDVPGSKVGRSPPPPRLAVDSYRSSRHRGCVCSLFPCRLRWCTRRRTTSPSSGSRSCELPSHVSPSPCTTPCTRSLSLRARWVVAVQAPVRFLQMGPHMQVPHQGRAPGEEPSGGAIGSDQGRFAGGKNGSD